MSRRACQLATAVVTGVFVSASTTTCTLPEAAYGRACRTDAECIDDDATSLSCIDGLCRTAAALTDPDPPDPPDDPDPPEEPSGEDCAHARRLDLDTPTQGTTGAALDDHDAACAGTGQADSAWYVDVPSVVNLHVDVDPTFDVALYASLSPSCGLADVVPGACSNHEGSVDGRESIDLAGVGPGRVWLVVDGADNGLLSTSGSYTITARVVSGCADGFVAVEGACVGVVDETTAGLARTNPVATLLDDGRVLVTGGRTGTALQATSSAEVFDPVTNTFSDVAPMRVARARHVALKLADGRVLVAGGVTGDDTGYTPTASVELWTPETDTWADGPALPRRRDLMTITALPAGQGYVVVGGRDGSTTLSDVLVLDAALSSWTNRGTLAAPRFGHLAFVVDDGDSVLVVGGRAGSNARALATVEKLTRTGAWAPDVVAALPAPRAAAAGVVDGNDVIVFGGYEGDADAGFIGKASAVVYDVDNDGWDEVFQNMTEARLFATATPWRAFGVVVAGGSQDAPTASVELFDPLAQTFSSLPPLHHARLAHAAVALDDGRVLVVGGDGGNGSVTLPLASAELIGVAP
jgi:hypothetical protein